MVLYSIQFLHQITTYVRFIRWKQELYSIQFLHQITTLHDRYVEYSALYSIQFLHQITTGLGAASAGQGCIVSNFYIKSQQMVIRPIPTTVV